MWTSVVVGIAFWAESSFTKVPEKPACAAEMRGQMWPLEANRDPRLANRLAREGLLEICNRGPWRYHWKSPSVHVRQLIEKARKEKRGRV